MKTLPATSFRTDYDKTVLEEHFTVGSSHVLVALRYDLKLIITLIPNYFNKTFYCYDTVVYYPA